MCYKLDVKDYGRGVSDHVAREENAWIFSGPFEGRECVVTEHDLWNTASAEEAICPDVTRNT